MSELFDGLREVVRAEMARLNVPGVAFAVLSGGEVESGGLGVTSVENPLPVTADTLFQIGSITKTVLATAAARLAEQGRLDLDSPARRYLPDLRLADHEAQERVSVRHLLTHTSGLRGDFFIDTGWGDDALARYVARMADLEQVAPLGTLWSYCNSGFCLAGRVVEAVTGKTAEAAVAELVFAPLGMDRAFFFPQDAMVHRFATGHHSADAGASVARPWPIPRASNPAGGISTTVEQLLRYARFHLKGGPVLSDEWRARMQRPEAPAGNFADEVGLAWMLRTMGGVRLVRHGGSTNGQQAELVLAPTRGFAIALLTNSDRGGQLNTAAVAWALEHYLGARPEPAAHVAVAPERLAEYAGRYSAALQDMELRVDGGALVAQALPRGGFPTEDTPPPETPPPPTRLAFTADDRVVALDPPYRDGRAEFLRDDAGRVAWFRFGGRAHRRRR